MNQFSPEHPETEFYEPITIFEFDQKFCASWLYRTMMTALVIFVFTLIPAAMILYTNKFFWCTVLAVALIPTLTVFLIYFYRYIIHHFKLCCPYCKKSLQREFEGFKSYIRTKGHLYSNNNPFVDGRCFHCKNVIIDTDQRLNSHLQKRNIFFKTNRKPILIALCWIIGFIFFTITFDNKNEVPNDDFQKKNIDVKSARRQIAAGNFEKAIETLAFIHVREPNYCTVNELLGYIYLQQDELEKSLFYYQKALPYSIETDNIESAISLVNQRLKDE